METALFALADVWLTRSQPNGQIQQVLRGVSVTLTDGGITCVVGPSGSGKSTLLRLLNRLEDPSRGTVRYRGQEVRTLDPLQLRREVGMVMQNPIMLPGTVRANLEAGRRIRNEVLSDPAGWLGRVGLPPSFLEKPADQLSGGEKQRVALARTLVTDPQVLLLDEPTAALDPDSARAVEQLILATGLPAVWVSHDMAQVERVAGRVLRLEAGVVEEEGR